VGIAPEIDRVVKVVDVEARFVVDPDPMDRKQSHRKRLPPVIACEIAELAEKLKRKGVRDPARQARDTLAQRWGFASGASLHKWLRRNR
jgi:hypothetical protein